MASRAPSFGCFCACVHVVSAAEREVSQAVVAEALRTGETVDQDECVFGFILPTDEGLRLCPLIMNTPF